MNGEVILYISDTLLQAYNYSELSNLLTFKVNNATGEQAV